jgi:cytochrome c553
VNIAGAAAIRIAAVVVLACVPLHAVADAAAGEQKAQLCLLCHKEGPELRFAPFLDAQPADFLVASITAFKTGQRIQAAMNANAANLSQADIRDIADYFASKPSQFSNDSLEPAKVASGEKLVGEMKCASCHGPTFRGAGAVPRLAGQKQQYLAWQLQAFRGGARTHPPGMQLPKDPADAQDIAAYLASLR